MSSTPAVSVVIPLYNAAPYVAQSIRSVLGQTFADFELIVIDDGSTDGSAEVAESAAGGDSRFRLERQKNSGVSAASNRGTESALGEFLRVDADDICLPRRLERQVGYLREHSDCVAVGSRVMFIDQEGLPLFEMPGIGRSHEEIDRGLLSVEWTILQPATMFRTSALKAVGGYRTDLNIHEDHDVFLKLAEIGKLANVDEVLFQYRQRRNSAVTVYADRHVKSFRSVFEEAWKRRGLEGKRALPEIAPHPDYREKMLKQHRLWGWKGAGGGE